MEGFATQISMLIYQQRGSRELSIKGYNIKSNLEKHIDLKDLR
jgi:hypothetical protein